MSGSVRVLHVAADPHLANLTASFLERENDRLTVDTAASAQSGLEFLTDSDFDCIVAEYDLSAQTGLDFLTSVREEFPDLPFILFTDDGSEDIASEAISAGVSDYFQRGESDQFAAVADRIVGLVDADRSEHPHERGRDEQTQPSPERVHRLEERNEQLNRIFRLISHDLRNPLNVAVGRLELARADCDNEHLATVADTLDRMEHIIANTLALAEQGRTVGETQLIDVSALATRCWEQTIMSDATLEVVDEVEIRGDPDRVWHVFKNLFDNAIVHGSEPVRVRIGATSDGGFYVADDGPGIPEDQREEVFDPSFSTGQTGSGFGLAIVREVIEAHGWKINVTESTSGGARFEIRTQDSTDN